VPRATSARRLSGNFGTASRRAGTRASTHPSAALPPPSVAAALLRRGGPFHRGTRSARRRGWGGSTSVPAIADGPRSVGGDSRDVCRGRGYCYSGKDASAARYARRMA
jgi:hypothetical protein